MKAISTFFAIVLTINTVSNAQPTKLYEILEFRKAIRNETRTGYGEPGCKYWQNYSDYSLEAYIDTSKNILNGKGSITYHNNSLVTLKDLHIRLYQDLYKIGSARNFPSAVKDIHDGTYIDSLSINGKQYILLNKPANHMIANRSCTDLYIILSDSIVSGSSCVIELSWNFIIPSSQWPRRLGRYSDDFFLAQWYPQIAVFDDILGWDELCHYGLQEFYNDFNNYNVTIKVPDGYIVWATGECDNLAEVLDESTFNNLKLAGNSDTNVTIMNSGAHKTDQFKENIWHFTAEHVPDFAFAAATNYVWEGTSVTVDQKTGRKVLVDIVYPSESNLPLNTLQAARDAILWTSESFPGIPYPYSHATSFFNDLGNDVSMEFPMITNDNIYLNPGEHKATVVHELFHNYMPFFMGFNETIFGWMDEGWVTFLENKFTGDGFSYFESGIAGYSEIAGSIYDRPLFTASMDNGINNRHYLSYFKPAFNLMLLEELIGEVAFANATQDFMKTWNGKHPAPYDFFNTFNKYAGMDIIWFWKACYFDYGFADLSIKSADRNTVTIERKGSIPVSINLEIIYDDNSKESIYKNLSIWETGRTEYLVKLRSNKAIRKITLGDRLTPDIDLTNNTFQY